MKHMFNYLLGRHLSAQRAASLPSPSRLDRKINRNRKAAHNRRQSKQIMLTAKPNVQTSKLPVPFHTAIDFLSVNTCRWSDWYRSVHVSSRSNQQWQKTCASTVKIWDFRACVWISSFYAYPKLKNWRHPESTPTRTWCSPFEANLYQWMWRNIRSWNITRS